MTRPGHHLESHQVVAMVELYARAGNVARLRLALGAWKERPARHDGT